MKKLLLCLLFAGSAHAFVSQNNCKVSATKTGSAVPTGAQVLAANNLRRCLMIANNGAGTIYATFGALQGATTDGVQIATNTVLNLMPQPFVDKLFLTTQSGTNAYTVYEGQ